MNKRIKQLFSALTAFCLALSLVPSTALAADSANGNSGNFPFTDVAPGSQSYEAVQYVYDKGMMSGTSATTFSPSGTTTRGAIVTILHRLEGTPAASGQSFPDVPDGYWCKDAVSWASSNQIVNGYGNGNFGPRNNITREQMAAILYRYSAYKGYDVSKTSSISSFSDADKVGSFATDAMGWAIGSGLISGVGNNTLAPKGNATRAQAAMILMRYCKNIIPSTSIPETPDTPTSDDRSNQTYTVSFDLNYNGSGTAPDSQTVKYGETITKPANPTRSGYTFGGWYASKNGGRLFDFNSGITSDLTLYAYWSKENNGGNYTTPSTSGTPSTPTPVNQYTVTFDSNGGSAVQAQIINAGGLAQKPADPSKADSSFDGWYTDTALTTLYAFSKPVTGNMTLYAKWSPTQPLSITITNESYNTEYSSLITHESSIQLTGTTTGATSLSGAYSGYDGEKTAADVTGTATWMADIPLKVGTNTVTLKASNNVGGTTEKVVYINRTSEKITYKDTVKIADEEDFQTIENDAVACWVDNNNTPDDESDDYIVMLVKDNSLLMSQINDGLLNQGEVYMIPQNEIFLTGFTGVYKRHQAPRGTENYPLETYPADGYEELIFDFPGFDDLFAEDISLDFSSGIDPENPIAFAALADGTSIDLNGNEVYEISPLADDSGNTGNTGDTGNTGNTGDTGNAGDTGNTGNTGGDDYPQKGLQLQELLENIVPSFKCSTDQYGRTSIGLEWDDAVIYDKDGKKNAEMDPRGELKLSGNLGIKDLQYTGGMEWHPSLVPWNFQVLPQQLISKLNYTFDGSITLKGQAEATTADLFEALNLTFENKAEFWGLSLSGTDTFKSKIVFLTIGLNLTAVPTFGTSIKNAAKQSTLVPSVVIYVFLDADGSLTAEASVTLKYENEVEKGFNIQKNGYTGAYGSQAQNRSDKHYTIGSDYTLDVYDSNTNTASLTFGGKMEASVDLGIGPGACLMIGGFAPASIDGEIFYRAQGSVEAEGGVQFYPELGPTGSFYAGLYQGLGIQADFAAKLLAKYKDYNITGLKFDKHWEHMFWEKNLSTSHFNGKVYIADGDADNSNNAVIADAEVTLRKNDTGRSWSTTTNDDGFYEFRSIPDGEYTMTVTKSGYDTYTNSRIIFSRKQEDYHVFLNQQAPPQTGICSLSGKIVIADTDTDMTNNAPLEGATIKLTNLTTDSITSTTTNRDGTYKIENLASGNYEITITKTGYITILEAVSIADNIENYYNAAIEAISQDYSGNGTASGTIYDAFTGRGVADLTLNIRKGINMTTGTIVDTIITNTNGKYTTPALPAGNYSVEIVDNRTLENDAGRYLTSTFTIKILGDHTIPNQNGYVTNGVKANQLSIVLQWGERPKDLDSHLVGPAGDSSRFHTYYDNKGYRAGSTLMADLDHDDTTSYGPEKTTIYEMTPGVYTFMVHDYTNRYSNSSTALANSGAHVEVVLGDSTETLTYSVPNGEGTLWTVFSYDSNTGTILPINTLSYQSNPASVGSNYQVRDAMGLSGEVEAEESLNIDEAPLKDYEIAELEKQKELENSKTPTTPEAPEAFDASTDPETSSNSGIPETPAASEALGKSEAPETSTTPKTSND